MNGLLFCAIGVTVVLLLYFLLQVIACVRARKHRVQRGTVGLPDVDTSQPPGPVGQNLEISVMFYTDFHAGFVPLNRWAYIFFFIIYVIKQRSYWIIFIGCASCWNAKLRLFMQILNVCGLKFIAQIAQIGTAPIAQIVIAQNSSNFMFLTGHQIVLVKTTMK